MLSGLDRDFVRSEGKVGSEVGPFPNGGIPIEIGNWTINNRPLKKIYYIIL